MHHQSTTELFRYYGKIDFAIETLEKNIVYCAKPSEFNDPFDGSIPFDVDFDASDFIASIYRTYKRDGHPWSSIKTFMDEHFDSKGELKLTTQKIIHETASQFREENEKLGILCLSETPHSTLMWSHYANNHKGVCIGFHRLKNNDLGNEDACSPINYSDIYPTPRFSQIFQSNGSLTREILFTKAKDWAYEKEWRLLTTRGNRHVCAPGDICKVIFGFRAPDATIDQVTKVCENLPVELFKAKPVSGEFALSLEKI